MEQHYAHVDYFVLAEAAHTFSGLPKPLHFQDNKERFERFSDKIIHVVIEDDIEKGSGWAREDFQRDAIARGLKDARPDDIILMSDVDEILRGSALANLQENPLARNEVRCFEQRWYQYYFNVQVPSMWLRNGPRAARYAAIPSMSRLRSVKAPADGLLRDLTRSLKATLSMRRPVWRSIERDAGWHFSWLGGEESVSTKLAAIPPQAGLSDVSPQSADKLIPSIERVKNSPQHFSIVDIDESFPDFVLQGGPFVTRYTLPFEP